MWDVDAATVVIDIGDNLMINQNCAANDLLGGMRWSVQALEHAPSTLTVICT
ncbi:hypothetical protein AB0C27_24860 [Nonomuraea sp. NPDC048882]|uniref:hypothetical protein n=1 Tax=Nonomuraea sp. NPDC048882 TaxID=3154347 RepID=UPI0033D73711